MCLCSLCVDRFLSSVLGTHVFLSYCRARRIRFPHTATTRRWKEGLRRWVTAVAELPDDQRTQVEWEQDAVSELSSGDGVAHLLALAEGSGQPPVGVPDGGPLALWFLLHRPALFQEAFLHHQPREVDDWYAARAQSGLCVADPPGTSASLASVLGACFRECQGLGRLCEVAAHHLPEAICFVARFATRQRLSDEFIRAGKQTRRCLHAMKCIQLVYYPRDGTVLLHSHLHSLDGIRKLLACFTQAVLGCPAPADGAAFALDRLKHPFHPPRDADDMELVRLKTLHLRYPARCGGRRVVLETLTSDGPSAIDELLGAHVSDDALTELRVTYAELHIRLRVRGRSKDHLLRLWPNRCDLGRGPIADRFLACLRRWGL